MTTFTETEAEKKLSMLLDRADFEGAVRITRENRKEFVLSLASRSGLDIGGIKTDPPMTADEIVQIIREGRERG